MRARGAGHDQAAEVARRRLELLSAELAEIRGDLPARGQVDRGEDGPGKQGPSDAGPVAHPPARQPAPPGRHAHRSVGLGASASGWLQDRLPATLQGRVALTGGHLSVLALVLAAALAAAAWWALRVDGGVVVPAHAPGAVASTAGLVEVAEPATGTAPGPGESPVAGAGSASAGSAGAGTAGAGAVPTGSPGVVVVDVAGKVRRPGIATLPVGSRVVDAIEAAGGVRRGVDLTSLNLARVLVDGEQVVVGRPAPAGVAAPAASAPVGAGAPAMVNINTATQAELETLPGVGPVTAQAILKWRADNGAFSAVDELLEVSGIGDATLAEMAPFVTL